MAARVEMRIAQEIEAVTPVESNPRIYVGGFPYLLALSTHKVPAITSESLDVRIPGLGLVNLRTEADRVTLSNEQLLNGNIEGAKAKALSHYMRLDGVALGSFLNITDLDISHPSDISPTSTSASEAQLTGTPPNFTEPVVAEVKLRIKGSTISIEPTSVRGAPGRRSTQRLLLDRGLHRTPPRRARHQHQLQRRVHLHLLRNLQRHAQLQGLCAAPTRKPRRKLG